MNKRIRQLKALLRSFFLHPRRSLLQIIELNDNDKKDYLKEKYDITQLPVIDLLELLPGFNETISTYSFLEGTSLLTDIALLKGLARTYPECKYLEIGTWRGESLANVAEVAKHCVSIDLSPTEMRKKKFSESIIENQGFFIKDNPKIQQIFHDSLSFNYSTLQSSFDLVFIDGDHHYESVRSDTMNAYRLLNGDNSIIVWHDYGYSTERVRPEVLAGILDGLPQSEHPNLYHVSNTLCAILLRKKMPKHPAVFASLPDKIFSIGITAQKFEN